MNTKIRLMNEYRPDPSRMVSEEDARSFEELKEANLHLRLQNNELWFENARLHGIEKAYDHVIERDNAQAHKNAILAHDAKSYGRSLAILSAIFSSVMTFGFTCLLFHYFG